jgi:hypothetical protein
MPPVIDAVCVICASPFERERKRGRPQLTCGPRCRELPRLRVQAETCRRLLAAAAEGICPSCGAQREHWRRRSQWPRGAIKMSALRQQRWRARQRDGKIVLPVEVDQHKVTVWLINSSLLAECDTDDRDKVAIALRSRD